MFDVLFTVSSSALLYFYAFQPSAAPADVRSGGGSGEWVAKGGPPVEYETPEGLTMRLPQDSRLVQYYNALPTTRRPVRPKLRPAPAGRQGALWSPPAFAQAYQDVPRRPRPRDPEPASAYGEDASAEEPPENSSEDSVHPPPPPPGAYAPQPYAGYPTEYERHGPPPERYPQNVGSPADVVSLDEFTQAARRYLAAGTANPDGTYSPEDYKASVLHALEYARRKRAGGAQESAEPRRQKKGVTWGQNQVYGYDKNGPSWDIWPVDPPAAEDGEELYDAAESADGFQQVEIKQ